MKNIFFFQKLGLNSGPIIWCHLGKVSLYILFRYDIKIKRFKKVELMYTWTFLHIVKYDKVRLLHILLFSINSLFYSTFLLAYFSSLSISLILLAVSLIGLA